MSFALPLKREDSAPDDRRRFWPLMGYGQSTLDTLPTLRVVEGKGLGPSNNNGETLKAGSP